MITGAVVFIVQPVRCCCPINQDGGTLGVGRREGTAEGGVVSKGIRHPGPAPFALQNI